MKTLLNTFVALALLLVGSVMTYPVASATAPNMHRVHPYHKANFAGAQALAPLSAAAPSSAHKTDGLSRNPEDCAKNGCIDNGGG